MPRYAKAGETITVHHDRDDATVIEIAPACELTDGHWYCVDHGEGFPHNLAATGHWTGYGQVCRFAWICHEHGPEAHE